MTDFLLRVLMIVSLVLNGPGLAMASSMTMMQGMDMGTAVSVTDGPDSMPPGHNKGDYIVASARPPCHGDAAENAVTASGHAQPSDGDTAHGAPAQPGRDCCHSGRCQCVCAPAAALVITMLRVPVAIGATDVTHARSSAHVPPALSHLIRPPIS